MFRHFVFTTKTTQPRPQVFSVNRSIIWQFCCTIGVITSQIAKLLQMWSTLAVYGELLRNGEIFWMNNNRVSMGLTSTRRETAKNLVHSGKI